MIPIFFCTNQAQHFLRRKIIEFFTSENGDDSVPEGGDGEGDPDPLGGVAVPLAVLVHIPKAKAFIYGTIRIKRLNVSVNSDSLD